MNMDLKERPNMVSENDIDWIYFSKYGEYISPLKRIKHYSSLREMKTIDSKLNTNLKNHN